MNRTPLLYYVALGWTFVMFIGCSWPGKSLPDLASNRDKWMHIAIFMLFGLLWRITGRSGWWVLMAGVVYGLLIEIWQGVMPINRSFDIYDALADTLGTVIGIGLAWGVQQVVNK